MEKRILGKTGLAISVLGYGAMELRHTTEQDAARLLNAVLDGGITYIDTSPDYGPSEPYIGKAIAHRRQEFYLASKCGCNIDAAGRSLDPRHLWTREKLLENVESSLRLLRTDHLDVWQLHGTMPKELPGGMDDGVIRTMQDLKQQGKVRHLGISFLNGRPGQELYPAGFGFRDLPEFLTWGVFDVLQIVYGGLTRLNEAAIGKAAERGIGMVARGVVKKYRDNYDEILAQARLAELRKPGESQCDFLIRFALGHPGLSTMIIGSKNPDHLAANIRAAAKGKLPDDIYREAKVRLDRIGVAAREL